MSWQGLEGHDAVVEQFRRRLARGRLASTYLFVGPPGVGKFSFAARLAKALLCPEADEDRLLPCGFCPSCQQVDALTHPDLLLVAKPPDKAEIPVALLIGPKERRMQEGLCHDLGLKPLEATRRVAIIDDADALNEEGANSLLKTLEEPPPHSVLILVGTNPERQLPTIRSRAQLVRFAPLADEVLARLIVAEGLEPDAQRAAALAPFCQGSLARARELADAALLEFRAELLAGLQGWPLDGVSLARRVNAFVEEAGKEASARRVRARLVIDFALEFYRTWLRAQSGGDWTGDADLSRAVREAVHHGMDAETVAALAERSLEALEHLERNVNVPTVVEVWIDDLRKRLPRPASA